MHSVRNLGSRASASAPNQMVASNFEVLGHNDLGAQDTNGDVWVHGNFAYVGTWSDPCNGRGVKIVDVSDLREPRLIGTLASRPGTSAEDMVVRRVSTRFFKGDLLAVGIQRCGDDPALDDEQFGAEFWDVSNPRLPKKLSELGINHGGGGVHELDLFQRGTNVYALLAAPFSEFFDPVPGGDFRIVDVTNPAAPVQVGEWGAGAHSLAPGPFFGLGGENIAATFAHSARASADGRKAYVSYWDLGVLTFDLRDVTKPRLVSRTQYPVGAEGDAHSVSEYRGSSRLFLLQNDEDFGPRSPAQILIGNGERKNDDEEEDEEENDQPRARLASESPGGTALWLQPNHRLEAGVVMARNEGCSVSDYPANTVGRIAVVRTPFPFFDPAGEAPPLCEHQEQDAAAEAAGAAAVVHDFISTATSPQWFDFGSVQIPVLFTDHQTAQRMVTAGRATLKAPQPTWGFLRVFDAATGRQVAKFDGVPNVHALPPPDGEWSIHNNEVVGNRSYASWYSNGVIALDLTPLDRSRPRDPRLVGQFVPPGAPAQTPFLSDNIPSVWGVAIRQSGTNVKEGHDEDEDDDDRTEKRKEAVIFASDMNGGLWIVRPTGPAAP